MRPLQSAVLVQDMARFPRAPVEETSASAQKEREITTGRTFDAIGNLPVEASEKAAEAAESSTRPVATGPVGAARTEAGRAMRAARKLAEVAKCIMVAIELLCQVSECERRPALMSAIRR